MSTTNSDTGSDTGSPPEAKRPKSDYGESSSQMMVPVEVPNQEISKNILQLNYDCFEQMFKTLSLKDLLNIRLTCKQLKDYADISIRATYPTFTFGYGRVEISSSKGNIESFRKLEPNIAKLIKKITFRNVYLSEEVVNDLKPILGQIDALEMSGVEFHGEFYKSFFQFIDNVKHLTIKEIRDSLIIGTDNLWLQRTYPNLESVRFDNDFYRYKTHMKSDVKIRELTQFFRMNPNVRTFTTTSEFFMENWTLMMEGNATFDLLNIRNLPNPCSIRDALKNLHAKGAYKRLQLHGIVLRGQKDLNRIGAIPAVEALYFKAIFYETVIPPKMTDLKEIGFMDSLSIKNPDRLAQSLVNVELIYFQCAEFTDILPFIRYSASVKVLYLNYYQTYADYEKVVIDVVGLNMERKKLDGACKMTIYVEEKIYLARKQASLPTKCSLIELDRAEAYQFEKPMYTVY